MQLSLPEHSRLVVDALPPSVAQVLAATSVVTTSPTTEGGWAIESTGKVGVIRATDVQLEVRPKVPVANLLRLLLYADGQAHWRSDDAVLEVADDLPEIAVAAFTRQLEQALAQGVIQGYVTREETMPMLRGRLLESAHMRCGGVPLPLHVRFDDFSADIAENRILRTAGLLAARLTRDGQLRRRLHHQLSRLVGVPAIPAGVPVPQVRSTRLNRRYQPALALARILLDASSLEGRGGDVVATGFVIDMHVLFERLVTRALRDGLRAAGGRVVAQHPHSLDDAGRIDIAPDVTWWVGDRCVAVVDAKYKRLAEGNWRHPDLYQMVSYAGVYGVSSGWLIHAGKAHPELHRVRTTGTRLHRVAVDLGQHVERVVADLHRLADQLATSVLPAGRQLDGRSQAPPVATKARASGLSSGGRHTGGVRGTPFG